MKDFVDLIYSELSVLLIAGVIVAVIAVVIDILLAVKFGNIAKDKGYKFGIHFIICLLFGLVGWIAVCALPDKITQKRLAKISKLLENEQIGEDYYNINQ